jgi:hypothetical protein
MQSITFNFAAAGFCRANEVPAKPGRKAAMEKRRPGRLAVKKGQDRLKLRL